MYTVGVATYIQYDLFTMGDLLSQSRIVQIWSFTLDECDEGVRRVDSTAQLRPNDRESVRRRSFIMLFSILGIFWRKVFPFNN